MRNFLGENPGLSDRAIALACGVSPPTVGKIRLENPDWQSEERITQANKLIVRERQAKAAATRKQRLEADKPAQAVTDDARELEQLRTGFKALVDKFSTVKKMALDVYKCDLDRCDIVEFGRFVVGLVNNLHDQNAELREKLKQVSNPTRKSASPKKTTPAAQPVEPTQARKQAQDATTLDDWPSRLLMLSPSFRDIVEPLKDSIGKAHKWTEFANKPSWKKTKKLVGQDIRDDAKTLITAVLENVAQV